jgi:hypothetical protein
MSVFERWKSDDRAGRERRGNSWNTVSASSPSLE